MALARVFIGLLVVCIGAIQYQLWLGRNSWFRLGELETNLAQQKLANQALRSGNDALQAELYSLNHNQGAIEERARRELNMLKPREILIRFETPDEEKRAEARFTPGQLQEMSQEDLDANSEPTFEPKKSDLYHAPKNQSAPKARSYD